MDVLYYWRPDNYRQDRRFGFGYHLNQGSPLLPGLEAGAHVWAFTRRGRDGAYVLAADLVVVVAVTANRAGYRTGAGGSGATWTARGTSTWRMGPTRSRCFVP